MYRKSTVRDLEIRLGHLYRTSREYEKIIHKELDLTKEQFKAIDNVSEEQKEIKTILDLVRQQKELLNQTYIFELIRFYRYLEEVTDTELKLILTLKHVHFLSWEQIADSIGGGLTARDVRKMHKQFILETA